MTNDSFASPASSLRWRARFTKEAMTNSNDESNLSEESQTLQKPTESKLAGTDSIKYRMSLYVYFCAVIAALWALVVTRSWCVVVSATLTVFHALLAAWQKRNLQHRPLTRSLYYVTRRKIQSQRLQNERLYRQLTQLDGQKDRLRLLQYQVKQQCFPTLNKKELMQQDAQEIMTSVLTYQEIHNKLLKLLQSQVQSTIVRKLLQLESQETETSTKTISNAAVDTLLDKLQSIPGVSSVRSDYITDILAHSPTTTAQFSLSNIYWQRCLLQLLQQVQNDASLQVLPNTRLHFGTTPRGNHQFFTPFRNGTNGPSTTTTSTASTTTKNNNNNNNNNNTIQGTVFQIKVKLMMISQAQQTKQDTVDASEIQHGDRYELATMMATASPKESLYSC